MRQRNKQASPSARWRQYPLLADDQKGKARLL